MIPEFPKEKSTELCDRSEVEKVTHHFPPYSDFNFTSLWMWDIQGTVRLSRLNDNLVVRFADYASGASFYSFLGSNRTTDTARALIAHSHAMGLPASLRLIPEASVGAMNQDAFSITEDRDNFDYVYRLADLAEYRGRDYNKKRNHVSCFLRTYPQAEAHIMRLGDAGILADIFTLAHRWYGHKANKECQNIPHELEALKRLLLAVKAIPLIGVGVFVEGTLVAFVINEILPGEYVLAHAMKADVTVGPGVYAFLMQRNAAILASFDKQLFNYEQDLGIENLRIAKMRFRPDSFLKKCSLTHLAKSWNSSANKKPPVDYSMEGLRQGG